MSNLLTIPFKKTYVIDIREPFGRYLESHCGSTIDAFKTDVARWEKLRSALVGDTVHVDRVHNTLSYHAQLLHILGKLPPDIGIGIPYSTLFTASSLPITLNSLAYERCCVLLNLAALYSQLAAAEDRSKLEGIKRATAYYKNAAGTLSYLATSALPKLDLADDDLDLSKPIVKCLESLMMAQAQECGWQQAKIDGRKDGLVSRIAEAARSLYRSSTLSIKEASSPVKRYFPSKWLAHIEAKQYHFEAVAQFRKASDDSTANKYGLELARLNEAYNSALNAYDTARRGNVSAYVIDDAKSLLEAVTVARTRAEKDNDLIYHQDVPPASSLPAIKEAFVANDMNEVPPGLRNPEHVIRDNEVILQDLLGWAAREALNIYEHRKKTLVNESIAGIALELDQVIDQTLAELNLPVALDALERPIGLPPSLLRKIEEVRLENGPEKIEVSLQNVQKLASRNMDILNKAMDILDDEASEDEAARKEMPLVRPPSYIANQELTSKGTRYRDILEQASRSDETIRQKWDDWEEVIMQLTWDEATLEAAVPSSTCIPERQNNQTQIHAQRLRAHLEALDELIRARADLVDRSRRRMNIDDVQPRIMKAAAGFERWANVTPAMFEDVLDEELSKYDQFIQDLRESEKTQEELLSLIRNQNEAFVLSRKEDLNVKDRERALQSLDMAYHKYREIIRNLDEGIKFYNDLAGILVQFQETCKTWSVDRQQEIHSLSQSMQKMADDVKRPEKTLSSPRSPPGSGSQKPTPKSSLGLPSIKPDEFEFEPITLPPGPR